MPSTDLDQLLLGLPWEIEELCRHIVDILGSNPSLSRSVKMGWKSVNFRHARAGHVCAVFPHSDRVSIYFEHGRLLEDPDALLMGDRLKKGRFLRLYPGQPVPEAAIALLVAEAIALRA
jgi:hypothetical protein